MYLPIYIYNVGIYSFTFADNSILIGSTSFLRRTVTIHHIVIDIHNIHITQPRILYSIRQCRACGTDLRSVSTWKEDVAAFERQTRTHSRTKAITEIEIRNHSFVLDPIWLSNA